MGGGPEQLARPAIMPGVTDPFAGLEPVAFWRHFEALTKIARPSFEEERVAAHVIGWAEALGFRRAATAPATWSSTFPRRRDASTPRR